jgi:hypothetical protein
MTSELPAELKAMADIAELFATLEEDEIQRVLRWANEKYRKVGSQALATGASLSAASEPASARRDFADLPELMDSAKPSNGLERILVAAYFNQVVKGDGDFDSQSVNNQLKNMGYPSANITRDMARLVDRTPKLVIQIRKDGTTQQARKTFRLTTEGTRAVENLLMKGTQTAS